jgi:hypothetical protein
MGPHTTYVALEGPPNELPTFRVPEPNSVVGGRHYKKQSASHLAKMRQSSPHQYGLGKVLEGVYCVSSPKRKLSDHHSSAVFPLYI